VIPISMMIESKQKAWHEAVKAVNDTGCDGIELHGAKTMASSGPKASQRVFWGQRASAPMREQVRKRPGGPWCSSHGWAQSCI
jgi:hypothetical protein